MSIDPEALAPYRAVMGDDADSFVADLIDSYLTNSVELVSALDASLAQADAERFSRSAHTLKSNSAVFGAQTLANLCQALETAGKNGALAGLQEQLGQLKAEHQQVCRELAELRRGLSV